MLDLSNNNATGHNFVRAYEAGQRRLYLKLTEGTGFHDRDHDALRRRAIAAGFRVGEYHFARPSRSSAAAEAHEFLRYLPPLRAGHALRPCLDLEDPAVQHPDRSTGEWALTWLRLVHEASGHKPIVYGSAWYVRACFGWMRKPPCPLWLASYGRNDGHEHRFTVPAPWSHVAALQYTSEGKVLGIDGRCDVSKVFRPRRELDVRRPALLEA